MEDRKDKNYKHDTMVRVREAILSKCEQNVPVDAIRRFRHQPDYSGHKMCAHDQNKPCNPGCLLWNDCSHGKAKI